MMSLPPYKRPAVPLVTSSHDRPDSSLASLTTSTSSASHLDTSGRMMFASRNPTEPSGSVFTPSSPPFVASRLRKASSSSQLGRNPGHRAFEHDLSNENEDALYAIAAKSDGNKDQASGTRLRTGNTWTSKPRHDKPISTGRVKGAGETETELDEPVSHIVL